MTSIHPHMHYRGKSMKYTAYYPDGETELLLDVRVIGRDVHDRLGR